MSSHYRKGGEGSPLKILVPRGCTGPGWTGALRGSLEPAWLLWPGLWLTASRAHLQEETGWRATFEKGLQETNAR